MARKALVEGAMSVGSLIVRDAAADSYAASARGYLKEVFDQPSAEAAAAFLCLAFYNMYAGESARADLYLVHAHSFCLNLEEFPLNLELCIEHLSHARLHVELRPNFRQWREGHYRVLHVVSHVLSTLKQASFWAIGLASALGIGGRALGRRGDGALRTCVAELIECMRISVHEAVARLICSSLAALLLVMLGQRPQAAAVAESITGLVETTPVVVQVMPLCWSAATAAGGLLFVLERHEAHARLHTVLARYANATAATACPCGLPSP
ncbi:unnamed protein product, partial [Phaeothamnion confervicola]